MTKYETNIILYLLPKVLFLGFGFKLLINIAGTHAWISIILGSIIGLGINIILTKIIPRMHKLIVLLYSLIFLVIGIILLTQMISKIYLDLAPIWYILVPLLLLIGYTITKPEITIYRVTTILFIFQVGLIIIAFIALAPAIEFENLIAINDFNEINIIIGGLIFAFFSSAPYILLTNLNTQYNYKPYLISSAVLLVFTSLIIGILTTNVALLFDFPEYVIFKSINVLGFLENMENILFSMWFIIYFPLLTISAYNIKKIIKAN